MNKIEKLQFVSKSFHEMLLRYAAIDSDVAMVLKFMEPLFVEIAQGKILPPKEFTLRWYFGSTDSPLAKFDDLIDSAAEFSHVLEDWPEPNFNAAI